MRGKEKSARSASQIGDSWSGKMDERMKELVAMGAAAAANCHPCMDHHLAKCDKLGVSREEVAEAVKVGLMVNHGAERAIRKKARELLGESMVEAA
jgi:AhpD family alkylhydroperoxidase